MPSVNQGALQISIGNALARYADKYSVLAELSLELDGKPYVPDISIYARLDLNPRHDQVKATDPPLTAIEILSPKQSLDELTQKADAYLAAGVQSCWIVQPSLEAVAVLLPDKKTEVYTRGELTDPPTGIKVTVEEIFRPFH